MQTFPHNAVKTGNLLLLFLLLIALPFLAISNQSLWIDEAHSALKAGQPNLTSWWRVMVADGGSDLQMPLYMIYLWGFAKIFGTTEFALRMANVPWLFMGLSVLLLAFPPRKGLRVGMVLAITTSPFVWYYLNEARPYVMQLGASFLVFGALVGLFSAPSLCHSLQVRWSVALALGIIFLCGSSMLGVVWAGAALLGAFVITGKERILNLLREFPLLWLGTLFLLIILGGYFVWTLKSGARASNAATTDIKSILFVFYELLGFVGLGPGRLEIRDGGISPFLSYFPVLMFCGLAQAGLLVLAWKDRENFASRRAYFRALAILSAFASVLFLIGYVTHFRVLARHFTPIVPAILVLLGVGLWRGWSHWGSKGKVLVGFFLVSSLVSCWALRFASRHQKDDYRNAAAVAKFELARGKTVWWNADEVAADYYHVPISEQFLRGKVRLLRNPANEALLHQMPDVVVVSKPDIYDARNALRGFLKAENYLCRTNFPAFSIWQRR